MRLRKIIAAAAVVLAPALSLAAEPVTIQLNGQAVPMAEETHIVETLAGPARVSTWSWHSPNGNASIQMQTSTGGTPPTLALHQLQAMQLQMSAMQAEVRRLEFAAFNQLFGIATPLAVMSVSPARVLDGPPIAPVVVAPLPGTTKPTAPHSPGVRI